MSLGLSLPIQNGNSGYFDQTNDTFSMYKTNLINLLKTVPGERRFNPEFGCRLWKFVFEQNDDLISTKLENLLKDDISKWIPAISLTSINIKVDNNLNLKDIYRLYINVEFTINSINQTDTVDLILNLNSNN